MTPPAPLPDEETLFDAPRQRMSYEKRHKQLLETALQLIQREGVDALTLGRLAQAAQITKPTVYLHFGTRQGLLAALYHDFEARQSALSDAAIAACAPTLAAKARAIAESHIHCVLTEGCEMLDILAALSGSPELAHIKKQNQRDFMQKCKITLAPFVAKSALSRANLWALQGAADNLAQGAVQGELDAAQASEALTTLILNTLQNSLLDTPFPALTYEKEEAIVIPPGPVHYENPACANPTLGQYSHLARVKPGELLFISGQLAVDAAGEVVGEGDFIAQFKQVFQNLADVLDAVGCDFNDIAKFTTYLVASQYLPNFMRCRAELFPSLFASDNYPPNTLLIVDRLVKEAFLLEVEAVVRARD